MPNTPFAIVLVAASTFAALAAAPCRAAAPVSMPGKQASSTAAKRGDMRDGLKGQAGKTRRNDKEATRKIVTYNLFQDPVFKLNGALADKRQLLTPQVFDRLGHSHAVHPIPASKPAESPADASPLKLQEPESAGINFGCRDKPFRNRLNPRELTACYKHNVDRSWKAQTYLSHEYADGSQKWGGGLAVRYAY